MNKNILSLVICLFLFSLFTGFFLHLNNPPGHQSQIAGLKTSTHETTVSASIGEFRLTLFGYTSPQAKVTISGLGIYDETYADETGYFIFNNRFSPFSPREACLTAQDVLGRLSTPLCLAPFPTIYNVKIGPVIMPPTVSVDVGEYFIGDEAMLSGQTLPNTEVNLAFFTDRFAPIKKRILADKLGEAGAKEEPISLMAIRQRRRSNLKRGLLRQSLRSLLAMTTARVEAFSFPQLQTKSDEKGNFAISLPTNNPTSLRAFARAAFADSLSPKSLTLNIKVLPWWMIIVKFFGWIFSLIKNHWLEISLLLEFIILFSFLTEHFFHPHKLMKTRAIVLRERFPLMKNCY